MTEMHKRNIERPLLLFHRPDKREIHRVLLRQTEVALKIDHPEHRASGQIFQPFVRVPKQRSITTELVHDKTVDQSPLARLQCRPGSRE